MILTSIVTGEAEAENLSIPFLLPLVPQFCDPFTQLDKTFCLFGGPRYEITSHGSLVYFPDKFFESNDLSSFAARWAKRLRASSRVIDYYSSGQPIRGSDIFLPVDF
jgi:hypothetical protein